MGGPERITVDLLQLGDAHAGFKDDTEAGLQPGVSVVNGKILIGLTFGQASASGEVDASRKAMASAMSAFYINCEVHIQRAQQVISFLDQVLKQYKKADDFAKIDVDKLLDEFAKAVPSVSPDRARKT